MKKFSTYDSCFAAFRRMLLAAVLSCQLSALADSAAIKLTLFDGTTQYFLLAERPSAKYEGNTLVIASQTQEVRVNLDDGMTVQVVYIDVPDCIEEITEKHQPVFRISSEGLETAGMEPNSVVFVYDLNGILIAKAVVADNGSATLPISGKGIFIVKTSVSSFKIKK